MAKPSGALAQVRLPRMLYGFLPKALSDIGVKPGPLAIWTRFERSVFGEFGRLFAHTRVEIKTTKDELVALIASREAVLTDQAQNLVRGIRIPTVPGPYTTGIDPATNSPSSGISKPKALFAVTFDGSTGLARLAKSSDVRVGVAVNINGKAVVWTPPGQIMGGFSGLTAGQQLYVASDGSLQTFASIVSSYQVGSGGIKKIAQALDATHIVVIDGPVVDPYTLVSEQSLIGAQSYVPIAGTNLAGGSLSTYTPNTGDAVYVPLGTGILNVANSGSSAVAVMAGVVVGPLPGAAAWKLNGSGIGVANAVGEGFMMAQPGDLVLPGIFGSLATLNALGNYRKLYVASSSAPQPAIVAPAGGQYLSEIVQSPKRFADLTAADLANPWRITSVTLPATSGE